MAQRATVDVEDSPELRYIVSGVRETQVPVIVREAGEDVAIVLPLSGGRRRIDHRPTQEQMEALRSAFGGWKGLVDPDELKAQIKAARGSNRPTYNL